MLPHRFNFWGGQAGFPSMILACGLSEAGAVVFGQAARPPVADMCVLLANGGKPQPQLPIGKDNIFWII